MMFFLKDCVDNLNRNMMNLTICNSTDIKCDDGICYSQMTNLGTMATCDANRTILQNNGYWDLAYPSEIFWKFVDFWVQTSLRYFKILQLFPREIILQKSSGIDETGHIVWQLLLGLFVSWLIILAMVINGIKVNYPVFYSDIIGLVLFIYKHEKKVSGKVVYFTSLFPYVVLLILGIRGWLLKGLLILKLLFQLSGDSILMLNRRSCGY